MFLFRSTTAKLGTGENVGLQLYRASYSVAGRQILSGLSLHLTEQRIGIVGRNGSGKTTLLRLLAGLISPTEGYVRVEDIDPAKNRNMLLAKLGILFQNPDHQIIFPTVEEEIAFGLRQLGQSQSEALRVARDILLKEELGHWAPRPTCELSQGQRQFLCLLSVLAMQPSTLLLDEPYAALDLPTQLRLRHRLANLPQRLITISHDPSTLMQQDRVIWIEGGSIQADGEPDEVLQAFSIEMHRIGREECLH